MDAAAPNAEDRSHTPDPSDNIPRPSLRIAFLGFLLIGLVAVALLLLASVIVVFVVGLTARWLGLPELHLLLVFLGFCAVLVVGFIGSHIGSEIAALGRQIGSAVERAGERIGEEVNASGIELAYTIDELPAVVVEAELAPRIGQQRSHAGAAAVDPSSGASRGRKPTRRNRR